MWTYERRLEYPVKICKPDPNAAQIIISQLGGPNGELGASLRYLNQRYTMTDRNVAGTLTDIGTEDAKRPPAARKRSCSRHRQKAEIPRYFPGQAIHPYNRSLSEEGKSSICCGCDTESFGSLIGKLA